MRLRLALPALAALLTHTCDDGTLDAANHVGVVVELFDHANNVLDVVLGGMRFHYDDHASNSLKIIKCKDNADCARRAQPLV